MSFTRINIYRFCTTLSNHINLNQFIYINTIGKSLNGCRQLKSCCVKSRKNLIETVTLDNNILIT